VQTAYKIDDMVRQLDGIFALLANIKTITDDTHLLALNDEVCDSGAFEHDRQKPRCLTSARASTARSTQEVRIISTWS